VDSFLKEQIRRIQDLTARMSALDQRAAELTAEIDRTRRAMRGQPFIDIRDVRVVDEPVTAHSDATVRRRRRRSRR
jgi:hypothetical protein